MEYHVDIEKSSLEDLAEFQKTRWEEHFEESCLEDLVELRKSCFEELVGFRRWVLEIKDLNAPDFVDKSF